ncbi:MAG: hypothetical protein RLZZ303_2589 [Candidatus Hydrogenedentota bacterium]
MARSKRRSSVRRNLLLTGGVVAAFAVLAVSLNFINLKPTLVLPEKHDPTFDMARREAPENAYNGLREAEELLPSMPDAVAEVIRPLARDYDPDRNFDPALGDFLGITYEAVPGPMADYLAQCGPAVERMRAALGQPYYLQWAPPSFLRWSWPEHETLGLSAVGHGAWLLHAPDTTRRGLKVLLDAARMARMIWREEGEMLFSRATEEHAMRVLALAARKPQVAAHLDWLQGELEKLGPPFADRAALLEQLWRKLDNTLTFKSDRFQSPGRVIRNVGNLYESRARAKVWRAHRDALAPLAALPPSRHETHLREQPGLAEALQDERAAIGWNTAILLRGAQQDFYFQRTVLTVALRRWQERYGGGFPESLEGLAPDFLAAVPLDPMNGQPFQYRVEENAVRIHGVGMNERDEDGSGDDMLLLSLP